MKFCPRNSDGVVECEHCRFSCHKENLIVIDRFEKRPILRQNGDFAEYQDILFPDEKLNE